MAKKIGEKITNLNKLQIEDGVLYDENGISVPVGVSSGVKPTASSVNPASTANTYGTEAVLFSGSSLIPQSIVVDFGGTFSSETVTTTLTATYSDSTTGTLDVTATSTGTKRVLYGDPNFNLEGLVKNGVYITKLTAKSKSNINSSSVTVTAQVVGFGK